MATVTPYLLVENLTKSVGSKVLFSNISFAVNKGQRIALIARNGIGKSTLLDILMGKTDYDEGKITWRKDLKVKYLPQKLQGEEAIRLLGDEAMRLEEKELALIQRLVDYPAAVRQAGDEFSPAVIANYAYSLACDFNSFYHDHSILNEADEQKRALRLVLAQTVAKVIKSAMALLGIEVPNRM